MLPEGFEPTVYLDGEPWTYTSTENATCCFVYLTYTHSQHQITIKFIDTEKPLADAGLDQTVVENTVLGFDASNSSDNVGIVSYEWDFGDGTNGTGLTLNHTYTEAGIYTITMTAR